MIIGKKEKKGIIIRENRRFSCHQPNRLITKNIIETVPLTTRENQLLASLINGRLPVVEISKYKEAI